MISLLLRQHKGQWEKDTNKIVCPGLLYIVLIPFNRPLDMNNVEISEKTEGVDFDRYVIINCFPLISSWTKMMLNIFYRILAYRNKTDHWISKFHILIIYITISLLQLSLKICFLECKKQTALKRQRQSWKMSKVNQVTQTTSLTQQLECQTEGKPVYAFIRRNREMDAWHSW